MGVRKRVASTLVPARGRASRGVPVRLRGRARTTFSREATTPSTVASLPASFSFALSWSAPSTGLRSFDFLGADDPFKLEWSETAYDLKLVQAFSRSPLGAAEWVPLRTAVPWPGASAPDPTAAFGLAAPGDEIRVDESCSLMCVGEDDGRTAAAWRADDDERAVVAAAEEQPGAPGVVVGGHDEELRPPARSGEPGDHPGLASGGEGVGSEADHLEVRRLARADGICCPALAAPAHRDDQRVGELLVEKGLCALEPLTVAAGPENDDCVCRLGESPPVRR